MKKYLILISILMASWFIGTAQVVRVNQEYWFMQGLESFQPIQSPLYLQGTTDTLATNRYVRTFLDTAYLHNDTIYFTKGNAVVFYSVVPVLTGTQITQIANSFSGAAFDTAARILTLTSNNGNTVTVSIPYGSGGGGGSGITALTSSKNATNIVTLTANTGATVLFSVHDTNFYYPDTIRWNGKMDSAEANANFVPFSDTSAMLTSYLRAFLGIKYSDTATLIASQWLLRKVADSAAAAAITGVVLNVNGQGGPAVTLTTTNISEGTNQYFTAARARSTLSATLPMIYNSSTGAFSQDTATQTTGLSSIGTARRLADSAAIQASAQAVAALASSLSWQQTLTNNPSANNNQSFQWWNVQHTTLDSIYLDALNHLRIANNAINIDSVHVTINDSLILPGSVIMPNLGTFYARSSTSQTLIPLWTVFTSGSWQLIPDLTFQNGWISNASVYTANNKGYGAKTFNGSSNYTEIAMDPYNLVRLFPNSNIPITLDSAANTYLSNLNSSFSPSVTFVMADSASTTIGGTTVKGMTHKGYTVANLIAAIIGNAPISVSAGVVSADTVTYNHGLATIANLRRVADSAAAAASGASYTASLPLSINTRNISLDTVSRLTGIATIANAQRLADSASWIVDTMKFFYMGSGIPLGYHYGSDSNAFKNLYQGYGQILNQRMDSAIDIHPDSTIFPTWLRMYKMGDSLAAVLQGAFTANRPLLYVGGILSTDTVTQSSGLATIANARRMADSALAASTAATGYNVQFLYGRGTGGLPIKNTDSIYVNTNLIGKNVQVFISSPGFTGSLMDSTTWTMLGTPDSVLYFHYNKTLGQLIFSNFGKVAAIVNGQTVVSIFGGLQGYPANVDTGTGPTLSVTPTSLSGFSTVTGTQSSSQTFTVTGSNLTANATVTAPASYVVSLSSGSGYGSSVSVIESGGTIAGTTVYVAISGSASVGSPSGNVSVSSTGAATKTVAVTGTVVSSPTLTVIPTSLTGFTTTTGTQSANKTFTLTGSGLSANAVITAPTNYLVSLSSGSGYGSSVTVTESGGNISSTTIFVVIASTAGVGSPSGNVTAASTGATTQNVAVSGTVSAVPTLAVTPTSLSGFSTSTGVQSATQTFAITGSNLTANATITAPTNYVVSLSSGSGFGSSVTVTESGGTISSTTIYVAIASTAASGTVSGNVTSTSTGATTQNVAVSGTVSSGTAMDSIRVQFLDSTGDLVQSGWDTLSGNLALYPGNHSVVGGNTGGITVTAIKANWLPFVDGPSGQNTCSRSIYSTDATNPMAPWAPNVASGLWYTYQNTYTASNSSAQVSVSGLKAGHTYTIVVGASSSNQFYTDVPNDPGCYWRVGSSLTSISSQTIIETNDGSNPNSTPPTPVTGITADTNGNIFFWFYTAGTQSSGGPSFLTITQTD